MSRGPLNHGDTLSVSLRAFSGKTAATTDQNYTPHTLTLGCLPALAFQRMNFRSQRYKKETENVQITNGYARHHDNRNTFLFRSYCNRAVHS